MEGGDPEVLFNYRITNIVASLKMELIHLQDMCSLPNVRCNLQKFPACFVKLLKGSCNIFSTGTVTFLGYKRVEDIWNAVNELSEAYNEVINVTNKTPHVHNIACTFEMCLYDLDLQKTQQLFLGEKFFAMYEPELCNGLQLELSGKQRAIIHRSGKGILTGFTKEEDIVTSLTYITNFILKHGKEDSGQ